MVKEWQACALDTFIDDVEFELSVPEFLEIKRAVGIRWFHIPILYVWVPDRVFEEEWETAGEQLRQILREDSGIIL